MKWMIYGATGYTGVLVAEEAVKRGHTPILAGRNPDKLMPLAERLGLEWVAFQLDDVNTIAEAIADCDIVYHAAGPFIFTSEPMIKACLATGTHYLDITGEIDVYEKMFSYDEAARKVGIALIGGVGFDVVPTDCLAKYVADQVPGATHLEIGFQALSGVSAGTTKSLIEMLPNGARVRRDGTLKNVAVGAFQRTLHLPRGTYTGVSIPWGDVSTAYRTTGIPNITAFMVMPKTQATLTRLGAPFGQVFLKAGFVRKGISAIVDRVVTGPSESVREKARSVIWAEARDDAGNHVEVWLETPEAYYFTALAGILAVERTAELQPIGATTPALAFGADFVLEVEGTKRMDSLA
jgi:short subunit dehydrogenase-like uncharacterized protein